MKKVVFVLMLCIVNLLFVITFDCQAEENILQDWLPGDGHVHTQFSKWDGAYNLGLPPIIIGPTVSEQVLAGENRGLKWMIFTDHEEMFYGDNFAVVSVGFIGANAFDKGLASWLEEKQLCEVAEQTYQIPVMLGEEVGSVIPDALTHPPMFLGSHGHYLVYNIGSYVFLSSYVLLRNTGQEMIDAVNRTVGAIPATKPLGFIAHPDLDATWLEDQFPWEDGLEKTYDYTGIEVFNGGHCVNRKIIDAWDRMLLQGRHLVAIGNSDAHWDGRTGHEAEHPGTSRTYLFLPNFAEKSSAEKHRAVYEALQSGQAVASNGPLLVFTVNNHQIGETAEIFEGEAANLKIAWSLRPEMGKMQEIRVIWNGMVIDSLQDLTGNSLTKQYPVGMGGYFRMEGKTDQKHPCGTDYGVYTNPIWVNCVKPAIFLTAPLQITPASSCFAGDTLEATFTIQNRSPQVITLAAITVKGLSLNPYNIEQNFPLQKNIILEPNVPYTYQGSLTLPNSGDYHFFCSQQKQGEGFWHPNIDPNSGLKEEDGEADITLENPVTAFFTVNPEQAKPGQEIVFTANCQDQKGEIVSLNWNFGDNPMPQAPANKQTIVHSYSIAGTYLVRLTAQGTSGYSNTYAHYVQIEKGGPAYISGSLSHNARWTKEGNPYVITAGGARLEPGFTLTVEPGVIVKFDHDATLYIQGTLLAQGTPAEKIVFTSLRDDNFGGDTNGDGSASEPASGDWMGILLAGYNHDSILSNTMIRYSGSTGSGNVLTGNVNVRAGAPTIKNSELSHSAYGIRLGYGQIQSALATTIETNYIHDNNAGIYLSAADAVITSNKIVNNDFGIRFWDSEHTTIVNNLIVKNCIAIFCDYSSPLIIHNTIANNLKCESGGGGVICQNESKPKIRNTILWHNGPYEIYCLTADVAYSDIQGGFSGQGNINISPFFADSADNDYHLKNYSPCLGMGASLDVPLSDLEGKPRPNPSFSRPDLGAYESARNVSTGLLLVQTSCPVDLAVTDPRGRQISKAGSNIPLAIYEELDLDSDSDPDDRVIIPEKISGDYFIRVQAEPNAPFDATFTLDVVYDQEIRRLAKNLAVAQLSQQFSLCQIPLSSGWNLISLPLQVFGSPAIILDSILADCESIWAYDAAGDWQLYYSDAFPIIDALALEIGQGYWMNMRQASTIVLNGMVAESNVIALKAGWNLVGYNSLRPWKVADALASLTGKYTVVWTYDAVSKKWEKYFAQGPTFLNNLQEFKPGRGYWIDVLEDCVWALPSETKVSASASSVFKITLPH